MNHIHKPVLWNTDFSVYQQQNYLERSPSCSNQTT